MPEVSWAQRDASAGPYRFAGPPPAVVLYVPVAIAFAVGVFGTIVAAAWTRTDPWLAAVSVALAAASALALLAARRYPGPTVAVVAALVLADLFVPPEAGPPSFALAFAIIGAVVRGARLWALIATGAGWLIAVVAAGILGTEWHPIRVALTTVALAACFAIGEGLRTRLDRADQYRRRLAARRVADEQAERTRIARELHDVLAHSLSQISVQSGVGLHLFDRDPEAARQALANIRSLSATGLDEVRGVLSFLRGDAEGSSAPLTPQPQLADLAALAAGRTGLGLEVSVDDRLAGELPPAAVQVTAYRIAQEALTNVVRHSAASRATISVSRDGDDLVVSVADDGTGFAPGHRDGGGIRGMRERAALVGGQVAIGPGATRGTTVEARLPWNGPE